MAFLNALPQLYHRTARPPRLSGRPQREHSLWSRQWPRERRWWAEPLGGVDYEGRGLLWVGEVESGWHIEFSSSETDTSSNPIVKPPRVVHSGVPYVPPEIEVGDDLGATATTTRPRVSVSVGRLKMTQRAVPKMDHLVCPKQQTRRPGCPTGGGRFASCLEPWPCCSSP